MDNRRSLKELGQIMLDNKDCFTHGLCDMLSNMFYRKEITKQEENLVLDKIKDEVNGHIAFAYAWPMGEWKYREEWIKKL